MMNTIFPVLAQAAPVKTGVSVSILLIPVVGILGTVFWIWMLVDCGRRLAEGDRGKLGWIVAIALTHLLDALAYFFFGRRSAVSRWTRWEAWPPG